MPKVKDCTTCGWGVRWERGVLDDKLHGSCQFVPSIPVPRHFGHFICFSERTPPDKNCPAWKKQKDPESMQRWLEDPLEHQKRLLGLLTGLEERMVEADRKFEEWLDANPDMRKIHEEVMQKVKSNDPARERQEALQ